MKISEAFPSNFLKCDDLNGKAVTLTIESAEMEEIGQGREKENKLIIAFRKTEKKLVCNKTNATTIGKLYGDDTDGWIGQRITLVPKEVEFQGELMWAIRVSLQKPAATATAAPVQPAPVELAPEAGPENPEDCPF